MQVQETKVNKLLHVFKTFSLLNSMVKCGDTHSIVSKQMYDDAISHCSEIQELIEFFIQKYESSTCIHDQIVLMSTLNEKINNFIGRQGD